MASNMRSTSIDPTWEGSVTGKPINSIHVVYKAWVPSLGNSLNRQSMEGYGNLPWIDRTKIERINY